RAEAAHVARAPGPVGGDPDDGPEQHHPVGDVHEKNRVNHVNRMIRKISQPNTKRYTPRHVAKPGKWGGSASGGSSARGRAGTYPGRRESRNSVSLPARPR